MNKGMDLLKRIAGTLMLPVAMFIIMKTICDANGKTCFGTLAMWRMLIVDIAASVTCAMGIGLQFKNGRFDFSVGAIMLVAAIVAGTVSRANSSTLLFCVLCLVVCVVLNVVVAPVYVYGRLPIMVARAAQLLGKAADAERYEQLEREIRAAILNEYFSPSGRLCIDTQTAYLLCLNFGVYLEKKRIVEGLKKRPL